MPAGEAEQLYRLADAHHRAGRLGDAEGVYRQILRHDPRHPQALHGLGKIAYEADQLDAAIQLFGKALAQRPEYDECYTSLGNALREKGDVEGAVAAYRRAAEIQPGYPAVHNNLGNALKDLGEVDGAVAEYQLALAMRPDFADARLNLGMALLLRGDFAEGWAAYESRREIRDLPFTQPRWDGSELNGRRILLHCRQGLGDVIQFVRFASILAERGGRVILSCRPELRRWLQGQCGIRQTVLPTDPLPEFDVHCPLLSLPHVLGTTLQTLPAKAPYLSVDPELLRSWAERVDQRPGGLRVGLTWACNPLPRRNRKRTIGLPNMAPLSKVPGVRFFSLQKGPHAADAKTPNDFDPIDWSDDLYDFADTAALVANLDLVITCDTSVAHVAGALGVPVWVGVPFPGDWRWLMNRSDSPWYPTMRLFRQPRPGDWPAVINDMARQLSELAVQSGPCRR